MRIGRASSLAAAKMVSSSARRRTFWLIRVVGRSPAVWMVGNSSASMPFTWVAKRPQRRWSVSVPRSSRSTRSEPGRVDTRSASRRAGTVVAPSVSILPGTQYVMPISRFVAVSLRPASSVRSRTFASTGSVLRLETARETTERPRARFSCMTESFTSGCLRSGACARRAVPRPGSPALQRSDRRASLISGGMIVLYSHPVITVILPWIRGIVTLDRAGTRCGRPGRACGRRRSPGGRDRGGSVDGWDPPATPSTRSRCDARSSTNPSPAPAGASPSPGGSSTGSGAISTAAAPRPGPPGPAPRQIRACIVFSRPSRRRPRQRRGCSVQRRSSGQSAAPCESASCLAEPGPPTLSLHECGSSLTRPTAAPGPVDEAPGPATSPTVTGPTRARSRFVSAKNQPGSEGRASRGRVTPRGLLNAAPTRRR